MCVRTSSFDDFVDKLRVICGSQRERGLDCSTGPYFVVEARLRGGPERSRAEKGA